MARSTKAYTDMDATQGAIGPGGNMVGVYKGTAFSEKGTAGYPQQRGRKNINPNRGADSPDTGPSMEDLADQLHPTKRR